MNGLTPWDVVSIHEVVELGLRIIDPGFAPDRVCACGRCIPGWSRSPRCDRCRAEHRRRKARERARRYYYSHPPGEDDRSRRRAWWRSRNPLPSCVDCGRTVVGRSDNKRCPDCRVVWRRQLNAQHQRSHRRRTGR